jgi:hypothetical protein
VANDLESAQAYDPREYEVWRFEAHEQGVDESLTAYLRILKKIAVCPSSQTGSHRPIVNDPKLSANQQQLDHVEFQTVAHELGENEFREAFNILWQKLAEVPPKVAPKPLD